MDELDGIPRGGHEPDSLKALWKIIKKIVADISVLQRAAPQRSMSLTDGGDLTIKNGGKVTIEDQGEVVVVGQGQELLSQDPVEVRASLANRPHFNSWVEQTILQAGLFLGLNESRGDRDPRVVSDDGLQIEMASAVEPLQYGPQVGPNMVSDAGVTVAPGRASIGSGTWDDSLNPGGGSGLVGHKGYATLSLRPHDLMLWLGSQTGGTPEIPDGLAVGITATLEDGVLQLYGRNGVNITGAGLTVDGLPVGGAVTSVAGKTGDVTLVKADVGLGSVDNTSDASKPVSTATQTALNGKAPTSHTHTTAQVTGLDTALAGKAPTSHTHTTAQVTGLDTALAGRAKPLGYRRVAGSSLPASLSTTYVSFAPAVTVPADYFGAGVPYLIEVFAQLLAQPTAGNLVSIQILVNGSTPPGGQVNGVSGPNFANVSASAVVEVTTSAATTINPQAVSPFGSTTIGTSGAGAPFFTIKITPYTAF